MLDNNKNLEKKKFLIKKSILKVFNINSILSETFLSNKIQNILIENFILDNFKKNFEIKKKYTIFGNQFNQQYFYFNCRLFSLKNKYLKKKSVLIQFQTRKILATEILAFLTRFKTTSSRIDMIQYIIQITDIFSNKNFLDITPIAFIIKKIKLIKNLDKKKQIFIYSLKFDF